MRVFALSVTSIVVSYLLYSRIITSWCLVFVSWRYYSLASDKLCEVLEYLQGHPVEQLNISRTVRFIPLKKDTLYVFTNAQNDDPDQKATVEKTLNTYHPPTRPEEKVEVYPTNGVDCFQDKTKKPIRLKPFHYLKNRILTLQVFDSHFSYGSSAFYFSLYRESVRIYPASFRMLYMGCFRYCEEMKNDLDRLYDSDEADNMLLHVDYPMDGRERPHARPDSHILNALSFGLLFPEDVILSSHSSMKEFKDFLKVVKTEYYSTNRHSIVGRTGFVENWNDINRFLH